MTVASGHARRCGCLISGCLCERTRETRRVSEVWLGVVDSSSRMPTEVTVTHLVWWDRVLADFCHAISGGMGVYDAITVTCSLVAP